jgi:hypothetical protein
MCAERVNRMYMRTTTNVHSTGSSSLMVEVMESVVTAKSKMIEERRY